MVGDAIHDCLMNCWEFAPPIPTGDHKGTSRTQPQKSGKKRRTLEVESCFARCWGGCWPGGRRAAGTGLALDATTLGQRFTVLCVSVLVRGCAFRWRGRCWPIIKRDRGSRIGRACWPARWRDSCRLERAGVS